MMSNVLERVLLLARRQFKLLLGLGLGLALGLTLAWQVWPVKWTGALPGDLHDTYKLLIVNGVAEDQRLFGEERITPGAEKILGYLNTEPLLAVNEALGLLRESENLDLTFQVGEREQFEANLLHLQNSLIEPPAVPAADDLPAPSSVELVTIQGENQFVRFTSWISILLLTGGFIWISYRMISPKPTPSMESVRFNSDLEIEPYDEDEEQRQFIAAVRRRLKRRRSRLKEGEQGTDDPVP